MVDTRPEVGSHIAARLRRAVHGFRTEGSGARREVAAIGVGIFIGCLPFYGFHLAMCWLIGRLLGLNRLKIYLAANISNPLFAPVLILSELQAGSWARRGTFHSLTLDAISVTDPWTFGADVLIGSALVGAVLAAAGMLGTAAALRGSHRDPLFDEHVRRAADRYVGTSIVAWEFARGKLRGDPVYRATLCDGLLPSGGTLLDVGCGQGLTLALLAEANDAYLGGEWPADRPAPPRFTRMIGVDLRPRVVQLARRALDGAAEIVHADARHFSSGPCCVVLLFDVLHMMTPADQETLIASLAARLEPGGVMVIRDSDRVGGWGFSLVRIGNRLKAISVGAWRQSFHFRSADEWLACFEQLGLSATMRSMSEGTPFANLLFHVTVRPASPGSIRRH